MWRGGGWKEKPQRCHCKSVSSAKTCANLCTSDPSCRSSAAEHHAGRCPSLPTCLCASVTHRQGCGRGGELWPIPWKDLTDPALPLSVLCLYPPIASLASVLWLQGEKCRCDPEHNSASNLKDVGTTVFYMPPVLCPRQEKCYAGPPLTSNELCFSLDQK